MPCRCDNLAPDEIEIEVSKMFYFMDELKTGTPTPEYKLKEGYHPAVYNKLPSWPEERQRVATHVTQYLCGLLQFTPPHIIHRLSDNLQEWWEDHKRQDRIRKEENKYGV